MTLLSKEERQDYEAISVTAVDASGCGDALAAGFITCWLSSRNAREATVHGLENAARCATQVGPLPAVAVAKATATSL